MALAVAEASVISARMLPTAKGALRLFRVFGIDVYIDWSWFIVAWFMIQSRREEYTSITWNVIEYLALFVLVLLHEFGHALACRHVGGQADTIVLWPLGGVAYVAPPQRPGPILWSLVAGPLVNAVMFPILTYALRAAGAAGWIEAYPNVYDLIEGIWWINLALLIFNMLPIYPLDGGQIFRALLWFPLGQIRSLYIATVVGFIGVAGLAWLAFHERSIWLGILAAFVFMNCRRGWEQAKALSAAAAAERAAEEPPPLP
jgi:Zn-dependent protease